MARSEPVTLGGRIPRRRGRIITASDAATPDGCWDGVTRPPASGMAALLMALAVRPRGGGRVDGSAVLRLKSATHWPQETAAVPSFGRLLRCPQRVADGVFRRISLGRGELFRHARHTRALTRLHSNHGAGSGCYSPVDASTRVANRSRRIGAKPGHQWRSAAGLPIPYCRFCQCVRQLRRGPTSWLERSGQWETSSPRAL